jgi:hypothetical protein
MKLIANKNEIIIGVYHSKQMDISKTEPMTYDGYRKPFDLN